MSSLSVARYSFILLLRHHVVALFGLGGLGLVVTSFALTYLTPETERRTFFDLVYLGVEALAVVVPLMASTVLRIVEFEQKTIWLVLARPITRSQYVVGRFVGLAAVTWLSLVVVLLGLTGMAGVARALPEPYLLPVGVAALFEGALAAALFTLISLLATSYLVAIVVSSGLVVAGYLSAALPYMADRTGNAVLAVCARVVYWILPHLSDFSVRDFASVPEPWYLWLLGIYAAAFAGAALALACVLFRRREI